MKCRLSWITALIALAAVVSTPTGRAVAADKPPNILFLLTDDQRWDTLGCMGNSIIKTPNIDRLSAQGVTFDNAFVTTSICMTSRVSYFTGQYAARHGINGFGTPFNKQQLANIYPTKLREAGYFTGFIGKWGVQKPVPGLFDYDRGFPGQGYYYVKQKDGSIKHLTSIMGDQALEFLDKHKAEAPDKPFCLSVSFKASHVQDQDKVNPFHYDPKLKHLYQDVTIPVPDTADEKYFNALPEFLQKSENRVRWTQRFNNPKKYQESVKGYYRLISGADVAVGRIVDKLKALGHADDTVIIFMSDHGFYLGEYGLAGKWYAHEVSIRIPLIVYDPRLPAERRGKRRSEMALNIDLAPTLLAYAGVKPPAVMQGRSVMPLVNGESPKWRTEFYYEHMFRHGRIPRSQGVRTQRWKYMSFIDSDPLYEELYDLKIDPEEKHNLAKDANHADRLKQMRARLAVLRERAR